MRAVCMVKMKFFVFILTHESSVHTGELQYLVIILAHESIVHCQIVICVKNLFFNFHLLVEPFLGLTC